MRLLKNASGSCECVSCVVCHATPGDNEASEVRCEQGSETGGRTTYPKDVLRVHAQEPQHLVLQEAVTEVVRQAVFHHLAYAAVVGGVAELQQVRRHVASHHSAWSSIAPLAYLTQSADREARLTGRPWGTAPRGRLRSRPT